MSVASELQRVLASLCNKCRATLDRNGKLFADDFCDRCSAQLTITISEDEAARMRPN